MKSRVHPTYKKKYRVQNWASYDRALVRRGDVTIWLSPAAIAAWEPDGTGTRGAQRKYSDLAIETALTLRLLFHLPLRQAEGFLTSLFVLMGLDLRSPDHTTLSRRGQHLDLTLRHVAKRAGLHLIIDSNRTATVEEDVTLPSASASREHLLPVQDDHRRWSSSQDPRWASGRSAARMQHPECDDRHGPPSFLRYRAMRRRWLGPWACRFDLCNDACAGKARSRGTRCRDVIFETLFETLWVSNPIRPRSAASRNRVMRGPGVTPGAKRSQGARRPRD